MEKISDSKRLRVRRTEEDSAPVPYNLTVCLGRKSWKLTRPVNSLEDFEYYFKMRFREFSKFLTDHPVSIQVQDWFKSTLIPDESFVPTMARISRLEVEAQELRFLEKFIFLFCSRRRLLRVGGSSKKMFHFIILIYKYSVTEITPVEDHSGSPTQHSLLGFHLRMVLGLRSDLFRQWKVVVVGGGMKDRRHKMTLPISCMASVCVVQKEHLYPPPG